MYGNIQQEQNRKNKASADEAAHKKQKTEGLHPCLKAGSKNLFKRNTASYEQRVTFNELQRRRF